MVDFSGKVERALGHSPDVEAVLVHERQGGPSDIEGVTTHDWQALTSQVDSLAETATTPPASPTAPVPRVNRREPSIPTPRSSPWGSRSPDITSTCRLRTFLWVTDYGWIIVPIWMLSGAPALGATTVLLEGRPFAPTHDRIWQTVEEHGVSVFGIAPSGAHTLEEADPDPRASHDLSSLRILGSTGEPWIEPTWSWFLEAVGDGAPIINASGGTELAGAILAPTPMVPLQPGTLYGPASGVAAGIYDEDGNPADQGYLVVEQPIPGMTHSLTSGDTRYLEEYWQTFEGVWNQYD